MAVKTQSFCIIHPESEFENPQFSFSDTEVGLERQQPGKQANLQDDLHVQHLRSMESQLDFVEFDRIFAPKTSQEKVFQVIAKAPVLDALENFSSAAFIALGATGGGKTFAVTGGAKRFADRGLIPRSISALFEAITAQPDRDDLEVSVSFYELYKDSVVDLLSEKRRRVTLKLCEQGPVLVGLLKQVVATESDAYHLLFQGDSNRHFERFPINAETSRGHVFFVLHLNSPRRNRKATLSFIDLAAVVPAQSQNQTTLYIGQSLDALKAAVQALQTGQQPALEKTALTQLLQPWLQPTPQPEPVHVALINPLCYSEAMHKELHEWLLFVQQFKKAMCNVVMQNRDMTRWTGSSTPIATPVGSPYQQDRRTLGSQADQPVLPLPKYSDGPFSVKLASLGLRVPEQEAGRTLGSIKSTMEQNHFEQRMTPAPGSVAAPVVQVQQGLAPTSLVSRATIPMESIHSINSSTFKTVESGALGAGSPVSVLGSSTPAPGGTTTPLPCGTPQPPNVRLGTPARSMRATIVPVGSVTASVGVPGTQPTSTLSLAGGRPCPVVHTTLPLRAHSPPVPSVVPPPHSGPHHPLLPGKSLDVSWGATSPESSRSCSPMVARTGELGMMPRTNIYAATQRLSHFSTTVDNGGSMLVTTTQQPAARPLNAMHTPVRSPQIACRSPLPPRQAWTPIGPWKRLSSRTPSPQPSDPSLNIQAMPRSISPQKPPGIMAGVPNGRGTSTMVAPPRVHSPLPAHHNAYTPVLGSYAATPGVPLEGRQGAVSPMQPSGAVVKPGAVTAFHNVGVPTGSNVVLAGSPMASAGGTGGQPWQPERNTTPLPLRGSNVLQAVKLGGHASYVGSTPTPPHSWQPEQTVQGRAIK